ncbi:hypothetical protein G9A89_006862 [Geosiphon pyriformis]|nr:hypothetical protein G9A89_006862 [Geosiphon pyriformis]
MIDLIDYNELFKVVSDLPNGKAAGLLATELSSVLFLLVCNKWNALVHKVLKSKSGLLHDFSNDALYHLYLYNLKTFKQVQAKDKSASVVAFANSVGILGHLFFYRSHNLQVLSWQPYYSLLFLARVGVSLSNNFLTGVVCIFSGCGLSLSGSLMCVFCCQDGTPMSLVLGKPLFFKYVSLLKHYGIAFMEQLCDHHGNIFNWGTFKHWKRLDSHGPVPFWFDLSIHFLGKVAPPSINSLVLNN